VIGLGPWLDELPAEEGLPGLALVACLATMDGWGAARQYADGSLPSLATYGVPDCWPHLRNLYAEAGFVHEGRTEVILVADVADLPRALEPPRAGLALRRSLGDCGTGFTAVQGDEEIGLVEVEADYTEGGTRSRFAGWADVDNLRVTEAHRRQGIGTWLLASAADWLRLGCVDRLLAYAWPEETDALAFLGSRGFRELTRTRRGWVRRAGPEGR
jgi:GNAT superfamily N-acetyltransferase